jgi:hypothetical protein
MRAARSVLVVGALLLGATREARADEPAQAAEQQVNPAQVDLTKDAKPANADDLTAPTSEAPPPPPYKKTLVLDATVGAVGFLGQFRKIAPPGPWMHVQLGYELLKWLMVYGEGELAFTDTSNRQAAPRTRVFSLFGFGGGARFTVRFTDRFAVFAQGGLGMMKADVPTNALAIMGFRDAESLGLYLGARLGVEWFQIDRHFALGLNSGIRLAQGFEKVGVGSDSPLALDGGASLRYAF